MLHPGGHGGGEQRPRLHRVGEVIAERIGHQLRHHDLGGEMGDGLDAARLHDALDQILVRHVADDQLGRGMDRPAEAVGQIVQHHDLLAGIDKRQHHVAADIARAARHQNRHAVLPPHRDASTAPVLAKSQR